MKISFFSTQPYDKTFFNLHNTEGLFDCDYHETALSIRTADLATGSNAVCVFVNDKVDAAVITRLAALQIKVIALRCAGFNNVDLDAARKFGLKVCRVPAYSPHAVAEHAVAMILTLNRKTHKAYNRVREQNFSLTGLLGFDLHNKTVGVVGTGNIGIAFCQIMLGFGCRVLAFDLIANKQLEAAGVEYLPLMEVFEQSDVISLHCPLNEQTKHLINEDTLAMMKHGAMLINTSRGGLIDTKAVIGALKKGTLGYLGLDVYEQEEKLFFRDRSEDIIEDDMIARLTSFSNVLITAHQGFFTREALNQIATTTFENVKALLNGSNLSVNGTLLVA